MKFKLIKFKYGKNLNTNSYIGKKSIKLKLIISYIILSLISILLIGSSTYINSKSILTNKVSQLSEKTTLQTKLSINSYLSEIQNITALVYSEPDILVYTPEINNKYIKQKEIYDYLNSLSLIKNFNDFALVYNDGSYIGKIAKSGNNQEYIKNIYENFLNNLNSNADKDNWFTGYDNSYEEIYYVRIINDSTLLLTSISSEEFDNIFEVANDGNMELSLVDKKDNIFYSTNKELIGNMIDNNIRNNIKDEEVKTFTYNNDIITLNTCKNSWRLLNKIPERYILDEVGESSIITIISAIISILISSIFALLLAKKISKPISELVDKMKQAAKGDLTVIADVSGDDELSDLSKNFNIMIKSIRDLIGHTRKVSDSIIVEVKDLKEMSKQTSETSDEICKAIGGIADGSIIQVNEIDKTISTMDNLSLNINNIISNITKATTMTNETKKIGEKSLSIVKVLDDKNTNTNKVMNEITSNIDDLTDSIREIEKVIELIKGISEQTNLLSLNASIEAARAGESGKGFAVVAEEVKKLADESRRSTESVSKVIKNVYHKANYTKNLLDSSTVIFSEQNEAVKFTSESFKNINYSIVNITDEILNIEKLMNEIKEKKSKTLDSVNDIRIIIENSSASVEEVLAATHEQTAAAEKLDEGSKKLTETMEELQKNLNIFKIKNN